MSNHEDFIKGLIKGKITELIFQQMILEGEKYEVTPLGYENSLPHLAHKDKTNEKIREITEQLRHMPDFVLTEKHGEKVYVVEVKYRKNLIDKKDIYEIASELTKNWNYAWLFVATQNAVYFDFCPDIIKNNGEVGNKLSIFNVSHDMQKKYLGHLTSFIHA